MISVFLLAILVVLCVALLVMVIKLSQQHKPLTDEQLRPLLGEQSAEVLRQLQTVREELSRSLREQMAENRMELGRRVEELRKEVAGNQALQLQQIQETLNRNLLTTNELQREKLEAMTRQQEQLASG